MSVEIDADDDALAVDPDQFDHGGAVLAAAQRRSDLAVAAWTRATSSSVTSPDVIDVPELLSGKDEQVIASVLFAFGRYLLASSSRPGAPPANLQGIWNAELRPAWSSNYTININTQMNYWAAEVTGLVECHEPLLELLEKLAVTGADVARRAVRRAWLGGAPQHRCVGLGAAGRHGPRRPSWALWQMGGAWLVQHAWDHYDFARDTAPLWNGRGRCCAAAPSSCWTGWSRARTAASTPALPPRRRTGSSTPKAHRRR